MPRIRWTVFISYMGTVCRSSQEASAGVHGCEHAVKRDPSHRRRKFRHILGDYYRIDEADQAWASRCVYLSMISALHVPFP